MEVNPLQRRSPALDVLPENLADNPRLSEHDKIAEASRQFESVLLRQILESSTKTVIKSKFADDSTAASIYHDMVTTQLADSISKSGGLGLAQTFEQQLNRPAASEAKAGSGMTPPALSFVRSAYAHVETHPPVKTLLAVYPPVKPTLLAAPHE